MSFTISNQKTVNGEVVSYVTGGVPVSPGGPTYENLVAFCVSKAGNTQQITIDFLDSSNNNLLSVPFGSAGSDTYTALPMSVSNYVSGTGQAYSQFFIAQAIPANTETITITFANNGGTADLDIKAITPISYGSAWETVPESTIYGWHAEDIQQTSGDYLDGQCFMIFN